MKINEHSDSIGYPSYYGVSIKTDTNLDDLIAGLNCSDKFDRTAYTGEGYRIFFNRVPYSERQEIEAMLIERFSEYGEVETFMDPIASGFHIEGDGKALVKIAPQLQKIEGFCYLRINYRTDNNGISHSEIVFFDKLGSENYLSGYRNIALASALITQNTNLKTIGVSPMKVGWGWLINKFGFFPMLVDNWLRMLGDFLGAYFMVSGRGFRKKETIFLTLAHFAIIYTFLGVVALDPQSSLLLNFLYLLGGYMLISVVCGGLLGIDDNPTGELLGYGLLKFFLLVVFIISYLKGFIIPMTPAIGALLLLWLIYRAFSYRTSLGYDI